MIKIACCQYEIKLLNDWEGYVSKIKTLVQKAKRKGATILLMPEYSGIESVCKKFSTDKELYVALQTIIPKFINLYASLASQYQMYILAGTLIENLSQDKYVNRAYFFNPKGEYDYQDKLQLTENEKATQLLVKGKNQKIFDTPFGSIGIVICYDSEFPEITRRLIRKGTSLILVPSYCTSIASYYRVFLSCRARAIENQCYVAVSFVVNSVTLSDEIDNTYGQASILTPADIGFPVDGLLQQGKKNKAQLICSELSFEKLNQVRTTGQVHNFQDASEYSKFEEFLLEKILF